MTACSRRCHFEMYVIYDIFAVLLATYWLFLKIIEILWRMYRALDPQFHTIQYPNIVNGGNLNVYQWDTTVGPGITALLPNLRYMRTL